MLAGVEVESATYTLKTIELLDHALDQLEKNHQLHLAFHGHLLRSTIVRTATLAFGDERGGLVQATNSTLKALKVIIYSIAENLNTVQMDTDELSHLYDTLFEIAIELPIHRLDWHSEVKWPITADETWLKSYLQELQAREEERLKQSNRGE